MGFPHWKIIAIVASFLALSVSLVGNGLVYREAHKRAQQGTESHLALCAFKTNLQGRVNDSVKFLKQNPQGIPGIPASVLAHSTRQQAETVYTLQRFLKCNSPNLGPLPHQLPGEKHA